MKIITDFISAYGVEILMAIITFVATYLGTYLKKALDKWLNNKTKRDIATTCVKAVEQIYKDLHGDDKLNEALKAASEMLQAENITITDVELRLLIEEAVAEFNKALKSDNTSAETAE